MTAVWRVLFALALAATAYASLGPLVAPPEVASSDKIAHLLVYGANCLLGFLAFRERDRRVVLVVGLIAFGCALELLQGLVPHRQPSFADVVANAAGVGAVALAARGAAARRRGAP